MATLDVTALLKSTGALKEGHFLLASGRHSAIYIEKFDLLRNPVATSEVCTGFVEFSKGLDVNVVVGPTTGGILLAFETARQLGIPAAYAERASAGGSARELRRGTTLPEGARVLVVDDILTTGGSVRETLDALVPHKVNVVGIGLLADRSAGKVTFGDIPVISLANIEVESWAPDEVPDWLAAIPLTKPGTTAVK